MAILFFIVSVIILGAIRPEYFVRKNEVLRNQFNFFCIFNIIVICGLILMTIIVADKQIIKELCSYISI